SNWSRSYTINRNTGTNFQIVAKALWKFYNERSYSVVITHFYSVSDGLYNTCKHIFPIIVFSYGKK
ncbi:hypothetical protein, partial [Vibrio lentus]|uniref:hypothetical protein n=1 Tax=Vibrio lentus TaxID=136468 RepID=UPI001A7E1446